MDGGYEQGSPFPSHLQEGLEEMQKTHGKLYPYRMNRPLKQSNSGI